MIQWQLSRQWTVHLNSKNCCKSFTNIFVVSFPIIFFMIIIESLCCFILFSLRKKKTKPNDVDIGFWQHVSSHIKMSRAALRLSLSKWCDSELHEMKASLGLFHIVFVFTDNQAVWSSDWRSHLPVSKFFHVNQGNRMKRFYGHCAKSKQISHAHQNEISFQVFKYLFSSYSILFFSFYSPQTNAFFIS